MSSTVGHGGPEPFSQVKRLEQFEHVEQSDSPDGNLVYEEDEEPELHAQTYLALAAMFFLNLVQVFGLLGPPSGVWQALDLKMFNIEILTFLSKAILYRERSQQ